MSRRKFYNVRPYVPRRTVSRDEKYKILFYALPHQFAVLYIISYDSPALSLQYIYIMSETRRFWLQLLSICLLYNLIFKI
jgi:hypothetical protein